MSTFNEFGDQLISLAFTDQTCSLKGEKVERTLDASTSESDWNGHYQVYMPQDVDLCQTCCLLRPSLTLRMSSACAAELSTLRRFKAVSVFKPA